MKPYVLIVLFAIVCASTRAASESYTTRFENEENPLSGGGKWQNAGLDWTSVRASHGIAFGTQTGTNTGIRQYDDSYAHLSGFPPDQEAWGQACIGKPDSSCHQELEILLRWTSSPHRTTGYECFARCVDNRASYVQVVRWEGPLGKFTYLADLRGTNYGLKHGDILKASIVRNVITVYINGIEKARVKDETYKAGNPGIGFFLHADGGRGIGSNTNFGFANFTARSLGESKPDGPEKAAANFGAKPWNISLPRPDILAAWERLKNLSIPGIARDQQFKIDGPAFYVSPTGSDAADGSKDHPWQTLQFAVAQLRPGTIIYLKSGTYYGPVAIKTRGTEQTPTALRAVAGEEVVLTYSEDYVQQQKSQIVQVDKEGATGADGKKLHYPSLITVASSFVEVSGLHLVGAGDRLPMNLYSENGISLAGGGGRGCRILYNEIEKTGHCGIKEMGHGGANFLIEGNYIHDLGHTAHDHAIYLPANDATVRKNLLINSAGWGIHAYSTPQRLTISHNIIGGHAEDSIILGGSDCMVFNNVFYKDHQGGVFFFRRGCRNNLILDNIIVEPTAFRFDSLGSNAPEDQPQGNAIDFNCLVCDSIKNPPVDKLGIHNIRANPQFMDAARLDFRVQPGSPCIDAGDPKVIKGYLGKAPDIGLYESGQ